MDGKILIVEDELIVARNLRTVLVRAGYQVCGIARSVQQALDITIQEKPTLVLVDIFLKGKETGIELAKHLKIQNTPFIYLSANSNEEVLTLAKKTDPYGFLVKPFREKDLLISIEIAQYRHDHSLKTSVKSETILRDQLSRVILETLGWEKSLLAMVRKIQPYIPFDFVVIGFNAWESSATSDVAFVRTSFDEYQTIGIDQMLRITRLTKQDFLDLVATARVSEQPTIYNDDTFQTELIEQPLMQLFEDCFHVKSCLILPLETGRGLFSFSFYSRKTNPYIVDHVSLFDHVKSLWSNSIERLLVRENRSKETIQSAVSERPQQQLGFDGIIGNSHFLLSLFDMVIQVAPTDTSVLLLGESGTGKELVADCIYNLSSRKGKSFIKLNCSTLPVSLVESELFGHEKGAFTGAIEKRIGKFELANDGTIFLDEIGELPVELQVKLLRVLQEKEIDRIGSKGPTKINVRIIAATNRNLEKEVAAGRFRLDLYYRLNVFPLTMPPLRDRKDDIPDLVAHFIQHYSHRAGKKVTGVSDSVIKSFTAYHWPGNIRELENIIERSVLLAKGNLINEITLPINMLNSESAVASDWRLKTMEENERDHIINVLTKCKGKIWGPGGAAEILNLPPSTLQSKMKRLGIKKEYIS